MDCLLVLCKGLGVSVEILTQAAMSTEKSLSLIKEQHEIALIDSLKY